MFPKTANEQTYDFLCKVLMIGNSSVGKTSILHRYCDDMFTPAFVGTVGMDFKVKTVFRQDKRLRLQIWDTAGQEKFKTITTAYYRGTMGFILVYDVTNEESYNSVRDWVTEIKLKSGDSAPAILVGNKCDIEDERVISAERGKQLADMLGLDFFETSARENIRIRETFERLVDLMCEGISAMGPADQSQSSSSRGTRLIEGKNARNSNCQC